MYILEESNNFHADVVVYIPDGRQKRRLKIECELKLIDADKVDELIFDDGDKGLLQEVLISVKGFDLSDKLKEKGVTLKDAAISNLPMRRQIIKKYLEELNGADEKNSRKRR